MDNCKIDNVDNTSVPAKPEEIKPLEIDSTAPMETDDTALDATVCTLESVTAGGADNDSISSEILLMPTNVDLQGIMLGATASPRDWDDESFKSLEEEIIQVQGNTPAVKVPSPSEMKEDLITLSNYLINLIVGGPCRILRVELQALSEQLRKCGKLYPHKVDKVELELWGQLVLEMSTMGEQFPGLEWRRAGMWESFLRERSGAIARVFSFDPDFKLPVKITRYFSLTKEMIKTNSPIPTNWARILDGLSDRPRYDEKPRTPGLTRRSPPPGFEFKAFSGAGDRKNPFPKRPDTGHRSKPRVPRVGTSTSPPENLDNSRAREAEGASTSPPEGQACDRSRVGTVNSSQDRPQAGEKRPADRNPDLNGKIRRLMEDLAGLKTEHLSSLTDIDRSMKILKAKRASILMKYNENRQRLESELKRARQAREREELEQAKRMAAQSQPPPPPVLTPDSNQGDLQGEPTAAQGEGPGLEAKIQELKSSLAKLAETSDFTRGKTNLIDATGWETKTSILAGPPPLPDYIGKATEGLLRADAFPADLAKKTARRVSRGVSLALDCEPATIGETINVIRRLSTTVQLQGCETCLEITNESHIETLEAVIPLKESKTRASRVRRFRLRTATAFIRGRSMEFVRAAQRMILGLQGHRETDFLDQYQDRIMPALNGLLRRLWWVMNLNKTVDLDSNLRPVQHYHSE